MICAAIGGLAGVAAGLLAGGFASGPGTQPQDSVGPLDEPTHLRPPWSSKLVAATQRLAQQLRPPPPHAPHVVPVTFDAAPAPARDRDRDLAAAATAAATTAAAAAADVPEVAAEAAPEATGASVDIGAAAGGGAASPQPTPRLYDSGAPPPSSPAEAATAGAPSPSLMTHGSFEVAGIGEVTVPPAVTAAVGEPSPAAAASPRPGTRDSGPGPGLDLDLPGGVELRNLRVTVEGLQVLPTPTPTPTPPTAPSGGGAAAAEAGGEAGGGGGIERLRAGAAAGVTSAGVAMGAAAGLVEELLRARGQRELLGLAPYWVAAPDFEKTSTLNQLLKLLWPQLAEAAEAALRTKVGEAAAAVADGRVPGLAALALRRCSLGPAAPPQIGGVKATGAWAPPDAAAAADPAADGGGGGGGGEELVVEFDVAWAAEVELELAVSVGFPGSRATAGGKEEKAKEEGKAKEEEEGPQPHPGLLRHLPRLALPPLLLSLSRPHLRCVARATLGPLLPQPPYLAAVGLTLLHPPLVDFGLGLGIDLPGARPGGGKLSSWRRRWRRRRQGQRQGRPPSPAASPGRAGRGAAASVESGREEEVEEEVVEDGGGGGGGGGGWVLDVMCLPGVGWAVRSGLQLILQRTLLYPRHLVIHLGDQYDMEAGVEAGVEAEGEGRGVPVWSPGLLRVRLLRGEGLLLGGGRGGRTAAAAPPPPPAALPPSATSSSVQPVVTGIETEAEGGTAAAAAAAAGESAAAAAAAKEEEGEEEGGGELYVTAQVRGGAVHRSPTRSGTVTHVWEDETRPPAATAAAAGKPPLVPASVGTPAAAAAAESGGFGFGGGGGGGGFLFELPVSEPVRQSLLLRVMKDQKGWDDPCVSWAAVPIGVLLRALRDEVQHHQEQQHQQQHPQHHPQQQQGDTWLPVVVHLLRDGAAPSTLRPTPPHLTQLMGTQQQQPHMRPQQQQTGSAFAPGYEGPGRSDTAVSTTTTTATTTTSGGGGGEGGEGGVAPEKEGKEGKEEREGKEGKEGPMHTLREMGRATKVSYGQHFPLFPSSGIAKRYGAAGRKKSYSADAAGDGGGGGGGVAAGGGVETVGVYGEEEESEEELYGDALHLGDEQAGAGRLLLEVSYIHLRRPQQPGARPSTEAADLAAAGQQQQQLQQQQRRREEPSGAAAAVSAVVVGLPDPRVAVAKGAAAGALGGGGSAAEQAGDVAAAAVRSEEAGGGGGGGGGGGMPVRVEVGALWPGGPARSVRRSVAADEKAILTVRVLRLRLLTGGSNTGATRGLDLFVELQMMDPSGRVQCVRRTSPRFNAGSVAGWGEQSLELSGAEAGGELQLRAWDKTSGWEGAGRAMRLESRPLSDVLLGQLRVPLMAVAAAGRLRRRWLLQPAGSRTPAGAAEVDLDLDWMPLQPSPSPSSPPPPP
ncbi:hypothetical protein PLESTB_000620500 [Pleodorina starrii]|uniref:C2 domain-containing protein n=1 Tax=Pleodorina starrii TaxID=330485 RepID=A0A9W6BIR9_9CHLO|nr:hypothetical protein PLESTM_001732300 [Pleodorina starrii]GLC52357.1 hypothetical protein PLESTB_000620500 [Pleodorina starrii]GLC67975.1 hypothetical protein PLESTF_000629800 [Pleodorina starrii]